MTCRACTATAHPRKSAHGLCLAHALMFLWGPWFTVEEFILRRGQ
jgi:hypothetical protein